MHSGHCRAKKHILKKPSHACLASAEVQISIFLSIIFTSGTNRLNWEWKPTQPNLPLGSVARKKSDWLIRIHSTGWSLRNSNMEEKEMYIYSTQTRGDRRAAEWSIYHQKYPLPSGAQGVVVCIRCLRKGILIRNQFVPVSQSEVCTVMWPELWSEFSIYFCLNLCIVVIVL